MSILIKGIDLPKDYVLRIEIEPNGTVWEEGRDWRDWIKHRQSAIQIDRPHGRLMDKDELLSHLKKDPLFSLVEQYGISGVIESRPTILEAEE